MNLPRAKKPRRKSAHYGLDARQLVTQWPSSTGTHDARYNAVLNATGLVKTWHLFSERLTVPGRWFLAATAIFFGYGTVSLELQMFVPLSYAFALWLPAFVCAWLARPRAALRIHAAERVGVGATLPVEIEVTNRARSLARDWRVLPHRLPPQLEAVPETGVALAPIARGETARVRFGLRATRRGRYVLRGFRVETDFPFGLLNAARVFADERALLVYPNFTALMRFEIPSGRRYHPGGVALAAMRGESLEYMGNRDFREGDNVRDIDWRATARLNTTIVREYREEYFLRVAVILDTHVPDHSAAKNDAFERAVSLCAAVGDYMARQDYLVDILAAGPNLYHLTAGRSLAYLDQILDILACVETSEAEPFEVLEPEVVANLAQITTVICIFLDWTESRRDFVRHLNGQGAALKVLLVRDTPCTLDPADDSAWLGLAPVLSHEEFRAGIEEL